MSKQSKQIKKMEKRNQRISNDLFDNPSVRNLLKSMSPEEIRKYRKIGEELYGHVNFEQSEIIKNLPAPVHESIAYIKEGLKSGLLIEDLEENEVNFLKDYFGENWQDKLDLNINSNLINDENCAE